MIGIYCLFCHPLSAVNFCGLGSPGSDFFVFLFHTKRWPYSVDIVGTKCQIRLSSFGCSCVAIATHQGIRIFNCESGICVFEQSEFRSSHNSHTICRHVLVLLISLLRLLTSSRLGG